MKIFREIQKIEPLEDGTIKAFGYASAPVRDAHGEIVTAEAMRNAIDDYMRFPAVREMHRADDAAGTGLEISLDGDDRTQFVAHIVDDKAVKKVKNGVYRGFSIGGKVKRRNPSDPSIIQAIELTEISLVDRPACPEATLDLWKRDDDGPLGEAHRDLLNGVRQDPGLIKETTESSSFEDKGVWDDGFDPTSTPPSTVASGGPYRTSVPDRGADAGDSSMPIDPNSGKAPVQSPPRNATQDTGGRGGSGGGHADYFSPIPGATNKAADGEKKTPLQDLFDKISEMFEASRKPPVDLATAIVEKRSFTSEQRRAAAKSGAAMQDGSYPILNRSDLATAIRGAEKAKNPAAVKAHIIERARALGATAMLPDDWTGKGANGDVKQAVATPSDSLATRLSKTDQLLQDTLGALERLEVRNRRGKATPEAYRLAKAYKEMEVDALAEVLAADALNKIAESDTRIATAEGLAKRYKEDNEALLKQIDETNAGLEKLAARLLKLEAQPLPTKTAGSVHVRDDEREQYSADAVAKAKAAFEDMTDEQRAMLLTKVALQHPRQMNLNPIPSPPRSIGGTAGGREDLR